MIRYRKLGYVELMVTDLEKSAAFYREIVGLQPVGRGPGGEYRFKCSEDPCAVDGMTLEYSFGMEEFPEHGPRPPRRIEPTPFNFDSWGSYRDPRMSTVGEIANHTIQG
jgi:2,3-dihydroxy-p-cumate/2,3-dihydroxybenzoate 3,4-dioxygenase